MSRIASELLGYDTIYFSPVLAALEATIDGPAIDAGLIGELAERSAALHRQLRLDPADTTPQELYAVLRGRVQDDNDRLAGAMGGQHPDAVSEMTPLIIAALRSHIGRRHCWALKHSVAKKLLKQHPPTHLMKALNYRSVDSLLKHEPIGQLMTVVRYSEPTAWQHALAQGYTVLTASDFESRAVELAYLDKARYVDLLEPSIARHKLVLHSKEMGLVAVAPTREKVIRGYTLRTATLVLHYVAEISMMSSLLKYRHAGRDYGQAVVAALIGDGGGHVELAGHGMHWRSAHHAIRDSGHDAGPHMSTDDWQVESANDAIARLVGTMLIWSGQGSTAKHSQHPVGFNVIDLAIDHSADASFANRSLRYVRRELEQELFRRYLMHSPVRHVAFARLGLQ